jgi:C4-dicarboxylate-binding protein DctP
MFHGEGRFHGNGREPQQSLGSLVVKAVVDILRLLSAGTGITKLALRCLALSYLMAWPLQTEAQPTKLRVSLQIPVTDPMLGQSLVRLKEAVETISNNAIAIEIFDRGRLYSDDQVVGAVESRAIEMGVAGLNQFTKKIPAIGIYELPFLFNFDALVRAAASPGSDLRRLVDKAILDTFGVRVLLWQSVGNQIFVSKSTDVTDPRQIKAQKIRVFSETLAEFVRHCGGQPVMLSAARLQEGMQKREIDMVTGAGSAVVNRELWTVADTITRTMHAPIEFFLIINEKTWQSLSASDRAILTEAARSVERQSRENVAELETNSYNLFRQKGMTVHELTADQVADWRACSAAVIESFMRNNDDLSRQLLAAYGKLRTDPCCSSAPNTGTFNRR